MKEVVIIGSGLAGMACAVRLSSAGFKVSVFEQNSYPGGKLSERKLGAYRFDAGPSLFTLPDNINELFRISHLNPNDFFRYKKLETLCHYFYEDGTVLNVPADKHKFSAILAEQFNEESRKIEKFFRRIEKNYRATSPVFLERSLHFSAAYFNVKTLKAFCRIPFLGLYQSMHSANESYFKDTRTRQLFDRYATYNGSDPYRAPALLNVIANLEYNEGAYLPEGGMHKITESIYELAKRNGVKFYFNKKVESLEVNDSGIVSLKTNDSVEKADLFVSNADVFSTYKYLVKKEELIPAKLLHQEKSTSALIFYWGIKKKFPKLSLHNILFARSYKKEFEHLFRNTTTYDDPTVYINITSKHVPDDAPEYGENWFVMINTPPHSNQNWKEETDRAKGNVIDKINRLLNTRLEEYIEVEEVLTPEMIEQRTSSAGGSLYGNASNNRYAAFLRHANCSKKIKNLYFAGGSVHPGGGIPLALFSAKICSDIIIKKES